MAQGNLPLAEEAKRDRRARRHRRRDGAAEGRPRRGRLAGRCRDGRPHGARVLLHALRLPGPLARPRHAGRRRPRGGRFARRRRVLLRLCVRRGCRPGLRSRLLRTRRRSCAGTGRTAEILDFLVFLVVLDLLLFLANLEGPGYH